MKTKRTNWKKVTTVMVVVLSILMSLMVAGCSGDSSDKSGNSGKSGSGENKYSTPVQLYVDAANNKDASKHFDMGLAQLNGFLEDEVNDIVALIDKSENGKEFLEYVQENAEEYIEDLKDEYGSDYKFTFEIEDKTELDEDALSEMKDGLRDLAEQIERNVEVSDDWDSDDWEEAANEMDLSVSQAKEYYEIVEKIAKTLKNADVSEGYELTVNAKLTGSKLDEPEEETETFFVYKIDDRWVGEDFLDILRMLF